MLLGVATAVCPSLISFCTLSFTRRPAPLAFNVLTGCGSTILKPQDSGGGGGEIRRSRPSGSE